jgi:hypothetical protein
MQDVNPFATRFVRPGALDYLFPPGTSLEGLVEKLAQQRWRGQIIGNHGTGKSTLLAALVPELASRGRDVALFSQGQGARRLAVTTRQARSWTRATQVVVDGYEQLGWLARRWLAWHVARTGAGILVTTHQDVGLPTLWETHPNEQLAQRIVATLLGHHDRHLTPDDVSRCYHAHGGNLRETLFGLYDLYEQRRRERS